jgi:hexosaminidase
MKGYSGGALITAKNGYNTVLSNGYYIDLMLSVDSHYLNDPVVLLRKKSANTGREAAMWNNLNIDSKIWPRTALAKDYGQMIRLLT